VDEVMKAFGGPGKAQRSEKSPPRNLAAEENSNSVTVPRCLEEAKITDSRAVERSAGHIDVSVAEETFDPPELRSCDTGALATENNEKCCPPSGSESLKCNNVSVLSESSVEVPDMKSSGDMEKEDSSFEIWRQQQQLPPNKSKQLSADIPWKSGGHAVSLTPAESRFPAVIGTCSLSPRPVYPRELAGRSLSATKRSPSSTLSSSSEERIPARMSSRVAASLVAASSSSLPARSSLVPESWSKLPHHPTPKVPSADSSDSESGNLLQRLKGKASLSRFSGLRLSVDSRTTKSGLPTQNLNVNVHFFNRLREQELQSRDRGEDDDEDSTMGDNQTPPPSSIAHHSPPALRHHISRSYPVHEPRISEHHEADSSGIESSSGGLDVTVRSPVISSQDEVVRLSCRSTESHDSFSEHSSTTTQPSDEGVYSDDSVAPSADELQPTSEPKTPMARCSSVTGN